MYHSLSSNDSNRSNFASEDGAYIRIENVSVQHSLLSSVQQQGRALIT